MSNPRNNGNLIGRVSQEPKVFPNADGSKVLLLTIAADDNFASGKDRKAKTQFVPVRAFIPKTVDGLGAFENVHKGDLIAVSTRISCEPYEKNGETVYPAPTIEIEGFPQFLESKAVVDARLARNAVASQAAAPAAAPAEETPEQTIARLQAELAAQGAGQADFANTDPFNA